MAKRRRLGFPVVGVAKSGWNRDQLLERAKASVTEHGGGADPEAFPQLERQLRYVDGDYADRDTFDRVRRRDVIQNHLLQVVSYLAMEAPSGTYDEAIRDEQAKVLRTVRPLSVENLVRGQFRGYRDEPGVARDSSMPTYAALRLHVDSWRWDGVPFYVRAGKCLSTTCTEVFVELRNAAPGRVRRRGAVRWATTCASG